uniref:Uncharacterized protein n=1 Tax=Candidatus Methanogaster sp. ANME-2c ERB4 TaxID=2759911 RepID=A0A7G9YDH0_9EURY|nr:hypothetical protein FINKGBGL_00004 [Methanosarcinales archaeon ANME-2c ERB4]
MSFRELDVQPCCDSGMDDRGAEKVVTCDE